MCDTNRMGQTLKRETFTTALGMDYFTEKGLILQTGQPRADWPLVIVKELVDNGLDAAEGAGVAPEIMVRIEGDSLTVTDNGPGISPGVVAKITDFGVLVSSKDHYVSPTRGQQGNALKTVMGIAYALSGSAEGRMEIDSQGTRSEISIGLDKIRQEPRVKITTKPGFVQQGTSVTVQGGLGRQEVHPPNCTNS